MGRGWLGIQHPDPEFEVRPDQVWSELTGEPDLTGKRQGEYLLEKEVQGVNPGWTSYTHAQQGEAEQDGTPGFRKA